MDMKQRQIEVIDHLGKAYSHLVDGAIVVKEVGPPEFCSHIAGNKSLHDSAVVSRLSVTMFSVAMFAVQSLAHLFADDGIRNDICREARSTISLSMNLESEWADASDIGADEFASLVETFSYMVEVLGALGSCGGNRNKKALAVKGLGRIVDAAQQQQEFIASMIEKEEASIQ